MTLQLQLNRCHNSHIPSKEIIFDTGNGEQSTWLVCADCSIKEPFTKFVVSIKEFIPQ